MGFSRVQLTGGEPFLHPRLAELAHLAFDKGLPNLEVFTNGNFITKASLVALPRRTTFALSFYSSDPKVHDGITGTAGSGEATVKAIDLLLEHGFDIRVAAIMMPPNAPDWEKTRQFLIDRGVPAAKVSAASTSAVGRGIYFPMPRSQDTSCNDCGKGDDVRRSLTWPGKAAVSAKGEVYPCIFARWMRLGNTHERSLADILARPEPFRGERMAVPERWAYCSERLSCPDCRILVFGLMGGKHA